MFDVHLAYVERQRAHRGALQSSLQASIESLRQAVQCALEQANQRPQAVHSPLSPALRNLAQNIRI